MNQQIIKSKQNLKLILYLVLAISILANFILTYYEAPVNKNILFAIQVVTSILILIVASVKSIINWKSFWIYLTIALVLLLFVYLRK